MAQAVLLWNFVKAFEICFTNKKSLRCWKETIIERPRINNDNDVGIFALLKYDIMKKKEEKNVLRFYWKRTT